MKARRPRTPQRRGSVLMPVVAAMLIMLTTGVALSELFGAQRMQSVLKVESTQAFWIAEAGIWHAAQEGTDISTAIPFADGEYTVVKSDDTYIATANRHDATRVVTRTFAGPASPLDEAASSATATEDGEARGIVSLVSISPNDLEIESFNLTTSGSSPNVDKLKLDGSEIWSVSDGLDLPTGVTALNSGNSSDRTVESSTSPWLRLEFDGEPEGTYSYTLELAFTDGSGSTIALTFYWDD